MRGVFVTGTGTEVGKTVVAAAIARTALKEGMRVGVFKPAVSGLAGINTVPPDHELLRTAAASEQSNDEIAPYRFGPAVSPHLAAELLDEPIDPGELRAQARIARENVDLLVCEGVGGFLVPLTPTYLVRDLARDLGHPVVIAASPELGTINHTLLTIESVREAGLHVEYVVLTPWPDETGAMEQSNLDTICRLGSVQALPLPWLDLTDPESWPRLPVEDLLGVPADRATRVG